MRRAAQSPTLITIPTTMPAMAPPLSPEAFAAGDAESVDDEDPDQEIWEVEDEFNWEGEFDIDRESAELVDVGIAVATDPWEVRGGEVVERAPWFHVTAVGCVESWFTWKIGPRNRCRLRLAAV